MQIVTRSYEGHAMAYRDDGWFNATIAAARFDKRPAEWLRLASTIEYMAALRRHNPDMGKSHIGKKGGDDQGTWMHPKLAVAFARWLDADFAVWCDARSVLQSSICAKPRSPSVSGNFSSQRRMHKQA